MAAPRILLEGADTSPLPFTGEVSVTADALGGEPLLSISPIAMEGRVTRVDGEYLLEARLRYSGELECSRCLAPFRFNENPEVALRLRPRPLPPSAPDARKTGRSGEAEEEVEIAPEDLDVVFYDEPVLPFTEIVSEQAVITIPMKPLCREDCRGLCPECGKDLNAGDCACERAAGDPRFAVLKNLKQ
jgi:uncharacterized protein